MKIHKILLLTSIVTVGMLFLCSCSKKTSDENLTDNFLAYSLGKTDGNLNRVFTTSNGTEMIICTLRKEDARYPNVLLDAVIGNNDAENQTYQWITSPIGVRMDDCRECAEMVIKYAKNKKWDNDYYLYVNIGDVYGSCDVVYDYEKDIIYIPNVENTYKEMYEKFGTFSVKDVAEAVNGPDFIIDNNLGQWQHNELETRDVTSYSIYLNDGEFSEFNKDKSTAYKRDGVSE